jgi:large subunit ribosomal protein L18
MKHTQDKQIRRHRRVRAKVKGITMRPRLSVSRSSKHIFAQIIDDMKQKTIVGLSDAKVKGKTKSERAFELGKAVAAKAKENKVTAVVFDRGGFRYQGRIERVAAGAREGGLIF